jgi:hypothetical protein
MKTPVQTAVSVHHFGSRPGVSARVEVVWVAVRSGMEVLRSVGKAIVNRLTIMFGTILLRHRSSSG